MTNHARTREDAPISDQFNNQAAEKIFIMVGSLLSIVADV